MAGKASEEEPQASEDGHGEAASAAAAEQEIDLFDRIFRRSVSGQEVFAGRQTALKYLRKAQKSLGQLNDDARGHSLAAALEREAASVPYAISQPQARKAADTGSGRGLPEAGRARVSAARMQSGSAAAVRASLVCPCYTRSMMIAGAMPPAAHMVTRPRLRSRRSSSSRMVPIRIEPVAPMG